jgi:hypothetical protein
MIRRVQNECRHPERCVIGSAGNGDSRAGLGQAVTFNFPDLVPLVREFRGFHRLPYRSCLALPNPPKMPSTR